PAVGPRRGRHSAPPDAVDPGRPPTPPSLHTESGGPPPHLEPEPEQAPEPPPAGSEGRRHRSAEDTGGQSVAELLARLQATPTGAGRPISQASRQRAERRLPDTAVLPPDDVARRAELLLLAVPDAELAGLVSGLGATSAVRPGTIVAHTSGANGIGVLAPLTE